MKNGNHNTSALMPTAFLTESGGDRRGGPLDVVGDDIWIKISSEDTAGAFTVFEGRTQPLGGPPLHLHREQDEWWYILEGEFLFEVDGQRIHAGPGDTVFAPRGTRHTFQNAGSAPGRTLTTVVPGGLDVFFAELSTVAPRGAAPDPAKLVPVFEKHGLELLGPPLATSWRKKESLSPFFCAVAGDGSCKVVHASIRRSPA
jgi:mannose-6-phosphate isomerase-like protein (cupin superfamily)